jgi:hypothetical protein
MAIFSRILIALVVLVAVAWLGLQVPPFEAMSHKDAADEAKTLNF